jgi:DNA-binding transcriptional regulator YiaG
MEKEEFNELLKKATLSKKEFANIIGISSASLNNWGSSQGIPYWVESWLKNYIKAKDMDKVVEAVKPHIK